MGFLLTRGGQKYFASLREPRSTDTGNHARKTPGAAGTWGNFCCNLSVEILFDLPKNLSA